MRVSRGRGIRVAVAALALVGPGVLDAAAQEGRAVWEPQGSSLGGSLHGGYRMRFQSLSDFEVDDGGNEALAGERLYHRLRLDPSLTMGSHVALRGELDVFNGDLAGETSTTGSSLLLEPMDENRGVDSLFLREAYLEWDSPVGLLRAGQQTSQWGLGILANSGKQDSHFADTRGGDIVERVMFVSRPGALFSDSEFANRLYLALGGDAVLRDENADWLEGDRAYQAVGSLFYMSDSVFAGFYSAWRTQTDRETNVNSVEPAANTTLGLTFPGDTLDVVALDMFARYRLTFDGGRMALSGEGVFVTGKTTRGTNENSPDELDVRQWGAAVEADVMLNSPGIGSSVLAGYASGDANSAGDAATAFKFDPAWRVGMILFEDVLSRVSVNSAQRLVGDRPIPPSGARSIPTNGAVTNALFVAPGVAFAPWEELRLRLGALWAVAPEGLTDPYLTSLKNGGQPVNSWNSSTVSNNLGWELDGGVEWSLVSEDRFEILVGAAGGMFFPGEAFDAGEQQGIDRVSKARLLVDVKW